MTGTLVKTIDPSRWLVAPRRAARRRQPLLSTRRRGRATHSIEVLEGRIVLVGELLASVDDLVSFSTNEQSMWGPAGPGVLDTGLQFWGTGWGPLSIHPTLGSPSTNNYVTFDAATSGKIGVDFRAILDPGSVDASYASQATVDVFAGEGNMFTIVSQASGDATGELATRSPNIDIESNFVFELAASLGFHGEIGTPDVKITLPYIVLEPRTVNLGIFGHVTYYVPVVSTKEVTIPGISETFQQDIISFDVDENVQLLKVTNQQISIFEQDLVVPEPGEENLSLNFDVQVGINLATVPPTPTFNVNLLQEGSSGGPEKPKGLNPFEFVDVSFSVGDVTVYVPTLNLTQDQFSTENGQTGLRADGMTKLADIDIDADFLAQTKLPVPFPLGGSADVTFAGTTLVGFSYDLLDVDIGPKFSIGQDFEFVPELWVDLAFSEPVIIGGTAVNTHSIPVGSSLDVAFPGAAEGRTLDIDTQYRLHNQFRNITELLVSPELSVVALRAELHTFLGEVFDGTVYEEDFELADPVKLATIFEETYTLGGFNTDAGESLHLDFNEPPVIEHLDVSETVDEGAPLFLSGTFSDPNSGQLHTVTIDWGDSSEPTILELTANAVEFGPVDHAYADGFATHAILVTLADSEGATVETIRSVDVLNVAPTADFSSTGVVDEGSTASVFFTDPFDPSAVDTDAGFLYSIDFGNDGTFEVVDGSEPSAEVPTAYLADGPTVLTVSGRIQDKDGDSNEYATEITIHNVAPTITSLLTTAPEVGDIFEGQAVSLSALFADPGPLDTHTVWIDWGDGTISHPPAEAGGILAVRTYSNGGVYTITLGVGDNDGDSATRTTVVYVSGVGVHGDILYVVGTGYSDHASINAQGNGFIKVHGDFLADKGEHRTLPLNGITSIVIMLGDGDDHITIANNVRLNAFIDGGSGNDYLKAGRDASVLVGGDGNDTLIGSKGRDLLIGGSGEDLIYGELGDDVLIAGSLFFDDPGTALRQIFEAWTSTDDDYITRIANLRQGYLQAAVTVLDDDARDTLYGGGLADDDGPFDDDWYFADTDGTFSTRDLVFKRISEELDEL